MGMGQTLSHELSHWVPRQIEIISAGNNFDLYCDGIPSLYTIPLGYNSTVTDHAIRARAPLCCGRTGPGARSDRGAGVPVTTGGGGLRTVILASVQIAAGERQLKILSGKGRVRTQPLARSKEPPATGGHGLAAAAASDSESESD